MKHINLLDCTLRDGGYYNNWDFNNNLINDYLKSISKSGVEVVEIGFRTFENDFFRGSCAYTKDDFLDSLNIPKNLKIAVMVNASEVIKHKKNNILINTKSLFKNKNKSKVDLVRIAAHYDEVDKSIQIIKILKKLGYKVALNLMQISEIPEIDIENLAKKISKTKTDILYFADSMGSLEIDKIKNIIEKLRKYWKKDLGIHTHNNMSRAIINSKIATDNGVKWVDSTVTGMGRGPGNAQTEYMLIEYQNKIKRKINILPLLNVIDKHFNPLRNKYNWGTNPFYFLAGIHRIHPTFIQRMIEDVRFKNEDILSTINNLKSISAVKFKKELLSQNNILYKGKSYGTWIPQSKVKNKDVIIIGNGPSIQENVKIIEKFILKNKPFVIGLNTQKSINEKLINVRAMCNELRFLSDRSKLKKLKKPIIVPLNRLSNEIVRYFNKRKILNFGLEIKPNKFEFRKNSAVLPNSLVISYALAIAVSGKAKRILLAGFDGYASDDPRRIEMDQTFDLFKKYSKKIQALSITATKYKVKSISIYAL